MQSLPRYHRLLFILFGVCSLFRHVDSRLRETVAIDEATNDAASVDVAATTVSVPDDSSQLYANDESMDSEQESGTGNGRKLSAMKWRK